MPIDLTPPTPGTVVRPDTTPPRRDRPSDLAKAPIERARAVAANSRRARTSTDELLRDPDFDPSLTASRARLEKALAIASAIALRQAENGLVDDDAVSLIREMSTVYRTLAQTEPGDPTAQRPGESVEDYRARLEAIAGGKQ